MSKGNMFINKAAGKVGNLVLYKRNGEQVMRAYQNKVKNPRTLEQVMQRAKFANAVKFYKRAVKNFFPFAFEDQKRNESAFNAFMRHNISLSPFLTKPMVDESKFPAVGSWMLTQGSLNQPFASILLAKDEQGRPVDTLRINLLEGMKLEKKTIGEFSEQLEKRGGFEEGDILTFVFIATDAGDGSAATLTELATDTSLKYPGWCISQFVLDKSSTKLLTEWPYVGKPNFVMVFGTGGQFLEFSPGEEFGGMFACAMLISRKTVDNKLLTSTSYLHGSIEWRNVVNGDIPELQNLRAIAKTWGSDNEAILKGSIANAK